MTRMGRQSRCSVAGTAADDDVVHGDRAPASGRTSGETGAASFGGALVAPDGEADRHCPTVAQRCGRRRPHSPPSPPWVKQEERRRPKVLSGIEQSRFQFSPSAESRRAKRCLARSGMRDLITGAINEGSCCGGLRESEPQKRRGRSSMSGRTDGRTSKDLPPPPSPSDVVRVQPAEKPTVRTSGRPAAADADIFRRLRWRRGRAWPPTRGDATS